jgi:hypothetical protein
MNAAYDLSSLTAAPLMTDEFACLFLDCIAFAPRGR